MEMIAKLAIKANIIFQLTWEESQGLHYYLDCGFGKDESSLKDLSA